MLMSEEQAAFSWCPFIRAPQAAPAMSELVVVGGCNSQADGSKVVARTSCIGSQCMCWRWAGWATDFGTYAQAPVDEDKVGPRLGYCGLAGKPFGAM